MDPVTLALIASVIGSGAVVGSSIYGAKKTEKAGKRKAKEMKRETLAGMVNDAQQRKAELEAQRLGGTSKLAKRKAGGFQTTADNVRGALNI